MLLHSQFFIFLNISFNQSSILFSLSLWSAPKKHKKHKKKHKHKRAEFESRDKSPVPEITSPKTSFKLKLKIGGETLSTKK